MRTRSQPVTPFLTGAAAVLAVTTCLLTAGSAAWANPHVTAVVFGVALLTILAERVLGGSQPPRLRSLRGFLWAPLGRVVSVPAGLPLYSGKMHVLHASSAYETMHVWAGWWNCRTLSGDPAEYLVFYRGGCKAVATAGVL